MSFNKNDVVVVVSSIAHGAKHECKYTICRVVAVGNFDLICEKPDLVYRKHFKVSKDRCQKIIMTCEYNQSKTTEPSIGDLVLSISDRYDKKVKQVTGVVEKIVYDPTDQEGCIYYVRTGQNIERCYLKNLIILERK